MSQSQKDKAALGALNARLDMFELRLKELRILYEQHFIEILPRPPFKEHKSIKNLSRQLLKAPFHNSQTRFRLRQLIQSYQTYNTYWTRVLKQKEEGTYSKDVFKAEIRDRISEQEKLKDTKKAIAETGMKQLFNSYKSALWECGANTSNVDYDQFRKAMLERARDFQKKQGNAGVKYKVVVKDGAPMITLTLNK